VSWAGANGQRKALDEDNMKRWRIAGWVLALFMATAALHALSQQDEGPILKPKPKAVAPATLLVMCDLACNWKLDGEAKNRIDGGGSAKAKVEFGQHEVVGTTEDGLDKVESDIEIKEAGQTIVHIALQPVRETRLQAEREARDKAEKEASDKAAQEQAAREESARLLELRDHATERLKEAEALDDQKHYEQARTLYQMACDGGNVVGCAELGVLYEAGNGVAQDFDRARVLYQKACDGGEMSGCASLSGMYWSGEGIAKNDALAQTFARKACDGGFIGGCVGLGLLYSGQGATRDIAQARALFQKACDQGEMSGCDRLGELYRDGNGVARNRTLASSLFKKACDGGDQDACASLRNPH
jgi:hypothetical protein